MDLTWHTDEHFVVDGIEFICSHEASSSDQFCIRKPRRLVEATVDLLQTSRAERVVELGIASGGSTALLGLIGVPHLVALEKDDIPIAPLAELISLRSLPVSTHYGVDQGDRKRLAAIASDEFARSPIDLVIDDASHRFDETLASFETLFPRLKPGGAYVIEDWNWQLRFTYSLAHPKPPSQRTEDITNYGEYVRENARPTPLETLALELVLARASSGDVVREVHIGEDWVVVTRGPAELDAETFSLAEHFVDPHGLIDRSPTN